MDALLKAANAGDALAAIARRTDDPTRDLSAAVREGVKRKLEAAPQSERLLAVLEGEEEDDREQSEGEQFAHESILFQTVGEGTADWRLGLDAFTKVIHP